MAYNNYNSYSPLEQGTTFNAELFHRQMTLEMLAEYVRVKQEKNYEGMFELLESIVDNNCPLIDTTEIDKNLLWLRGNKHLWAIKDPETGMIVRINTKNKETIELKFQTTHRMVVKQLFEKGIVHKVKEDPGHAMSHFES